MATFSRQQLYEAIWSKSAVQLAKEIGVSDVAVAKACKRHDIPKPPLGYWAKVQHGHKTKRPPLPRLDDPFRETIQFEPVPEHLRTNPLSEQTKERVRHEKSEENQITVPEMLIDSLPLVEKTLKSLSSAAPGDDTLIRPKAKGCLEVAVSMDRIDRAMRIMNSLMMAITARGMKVSTNESSKWSTLVQLDGEVIALRLSESVGERPRDLTPTQRRENEGHTYFKPHTETEKYPRGLLTLAARGDKDEYVQKRWSELDGKRLEDRLNVVVAWFYKAAEQIKTRRTEHEEWRRRSEEERRLREETERRQRENERKLKELEAEADAWRRARDIREYVDAAEHAELADGGKIDPSSELGTWIIWAREQADEIDPLIASEETDLEGEDVDHPM